MTACGLRTEGPVFFLEWGGEWSGDEEQFTVDVLLPCRQFMTYC